MKRNIRNSLTRKLIIHHYKDVPEYCYSADIEEVRKNDYSLVPSKYIEFINRDENIDFDNKMKTLQTELSALFAEQSKSDEQLKKVFKELGYAINYEL